METVGNLSTLKIKNSTSVKGTAASIVRCFEDHKEVELRAIGASAVNQAVKSIALARGKMATHGRDLLVRMGFDTTTIENEERTVMTMRLVLL